jgi:hypothetical protein
MKMKDVMKTKVRIFKPHILCFVLLIGINAFAGTSDGGGGIGVRCGKSLELLDLHEAKIKGHKLLSAPHNANEAIQLAARKAGQHFWTFDMVDSVDDSVSFYSEAVVERIFNGKSFLYKIEDEGLPVYAPVKFVASLPLSKDIGHYQIQKNCTLEQVAYMTDGETPKLEIVKSAWDELDFLSKAALVMHETLYHFDRTENLRSASGASASYTSEWTRSFVGQLFSVTGVPAKTEKIPQDSPSRLRCKADLEGGKFNNTDFYVFGTNASGFEIVIEQIQGVSDLYQLKSSVRGVSFETMLDLDNGEGSSLNEIIYSGAGGSSFYMKLEKQKGSAMTVKLLDNQRGTWAQIGNTQRMSCDF